MSDKKVRVAVIGVGNCASSFVQGVQFYKEAKDDDRDSEGQQNGGGGEERVDPRGQVSYAGKP